MYSKSKFVYFKFGSFWIFVLHILIFCSLLSASEQSEKNEKT